ncbi:hypothetical protein [Haloarcula hispanica]|uniref:hypothetical protein n=1 Tax=Haloarcula hispanica TaxID=51589 RepID=UPI0021BD061E|nr:hypothetical protein [Haloarcula hispanica]
MTDRDEGTLDARLPEHPSELGLVNQDGAGSDETSSRGWPTEQSKLFQTIVGAQAVWMLLMLVLLIGIDMLSPDLYFIVSFHGLVGLRLLFAPTDQPPDWWRKLDMLVYIGFIILAAVIFQGPLQLFEWQ